LRLRDASLSTSLAAATDTRPILDPRSGMPVEGPRLVTVLASRATAADAWSTALVVLGRDGVREAESKGLEVLLEDGAGVLRTPGFDLRP
jgi:thiamine biosynthesis lipoprotein ApbE